MKQNPAVSVIVPMYKVEKFIPRCMESIQNQTFTDFEVLMIDDGSPDRCAEIAGEFAKKDERFLLLHKSNGGLSDARNYGIARAKGEYLVFVDSDDCIRRDYLEVLYHECVDNDAEISYCRFYHSYFMSHLVIPMLSSAKKEVLSAEDALHLLIRDQYLHSYAWNKMYKKSLFTDHHITYPKMYFEDVATSPRVFFHAGKIAVTNKYLYYYEKRFGSIMATMNMRKVHDLLRSILIIRNDLQYNNAYDQYRSSVHALAGKMYLINIYSIFRQHLKFFDFKDMKHNMNINRRLYEYIISDDYQATDTLPELPLDFTQPERRKK